MATKHIISPGIGFSPGSVKYIITRGLFPPGVVTGTNPDGLVIVHFRDRRVVTKTDDPRRDVELEDSRVK